ncbi:hypothetical protein Ddye_012301 [Dipteronia dyeriana]|uniref:Retrotransposon gag domain-containing protein n=1 Tax=Dipteronia dyeriana TaxID=168575 RepID=A0AAD9X476_9ROSI|nr:hypothetical protein Ddye_012301 [Dipteronia dyeriana]
MVFRFMHGKRSLRRQVLPAQDNINQIGTLTTWLKVCKAFNIKFFPTAMARELKIKIATFSEEDNELLHEAWERFHLLLAQVPQHIYPDNLKVTSFYQGLSIITKILVDNACGGTLAHKRALKA